jgi:hypothetical protein
MRLHLPDGALVMYPDLARGIWALDHQLVWVAVLAADAVRAQRLRY